VEWLAHIRDTSGPPNQDFSKATTVLLVCLNDLDRFFAASIAWRNSPVPGLACCGGDGGINRMAP